LTVLEGRTAIVVVLTGLLVIGMTACTTPTPDPLPGREVPVNQPVDPTRPCSRELAGPPRAEGVDPRQVDARFDPAENTIVLSAGEHVSVPALSDAVDRPAALRELGPGEWLLGASITVLPGASLEVSAPDVRWLKMASSPGEAVAIRAFGGGVAVEGTCITSWDEDARRVDDDTGDGRSYLLARDGATMTVDRAEIRFLGSGDVESYGLSWRTEGTTGSITGSVVSHLYYGLYSYEVNGLQVLDNEFHDNVLYGIDPHTGSSGLAIERNVVHHNGKHGLILAEHCVDSVIRDNVVYANQHHGIVMYLGSDGNLIEGNESFGNAAQGININESHDNMIRGNKVYDNGQSGVGLTQTSRGNLVEGNELRRNGKDGIRLVSEAAENAVLDNTIGRNERYGIYIDTTGGYDLAGNVVFASRAGLVVRGEERVDEDDNDMFDNLEADVMHG
jgi:parallel beta-helix repeat protein